MGSGAEQVHALGADDFPRGCQRGPKVGHRLRDVVADSGDDLDGVTQQFLVYMRVFTEMRDDIARAVAQVAGFGVDERTSTRRPELDAPTP